jgi:competence protein ComEC
LAGGTLRTMHDGQIVRERTPLHLPLCRYFFPQVCAYVLAWKLAFPVVVWLCFGVLVLVAACLVRYKFNRQAGEPLHGVGWRRGARVNLTQVTLWQQRLLILCFSLACFGAYYEWREGGSDLIRQQDSFAWPESETSIELVVEQLWSNTSGDRIAGIGRVLAAPAHARVAVGERVAFDAFADFEWEHPPWVGSRLRLRGVRTAIEVPSEAETIAPFSQWLAEQGVFFRLHQATVREVIYHAQPTWGERANAQFESQLRRGLPEASPLADVYVAMLLGKRVALSQEQITAFRETGTMHFFAISGLHIKVIAVTLFYLLNLFRIPRLWGMVIGLTALALYVYITGASPSAVRAFLMVFFFWIGVSVSLRQHAPMAAWMNAAFLVLLLDPSALFMIGFQLSYAVVASIFLFGLPLIRVLSTKWEYHVTARVEPDGRIMSWLNGTVKFILTAFCVGLSAWLASTPLTLVHFNLFVPGAVLLNIPLVLLCTGTLVAGVLSLLTGLVGLGVIGGLLNYVSMLFLWLMTLVVDGGHETWLSGSELASVLPIPAIVGLIGFLLLCWRAEKRLSPGGPERNLTSFLPAVFLLALCCAIAIVGAWILI